MQEYPTSLRNATIGLRGCPFCGEPAYINLTPAIQVTIDIWNMRETFD